MNLIKQTSLLIPPSPFRNGDPPPKNAELTVYALGPDQDAVVPCLRMLGEFSNQSLRKFQQSLPCTLTLPVSYYDKSNAFVSLLRTTGTKFKIRSWSWVCPDEMASDASGAKSGLHWCTATCSVMQVEESVS